MKKKGRRASDRGRKGEGETDLKIVKEEVRRDGRMSERDIKKIQIMDKEREREKE